MWGWIVAALLWVTAAPFVFAAVRDPRGGDKDLQWLFFIIWPLVTTAALVAGIWQFVRRK